jgi:hypothetical protein
MSTLQTSPQHVGYKTARQMMARNREYFSIDQPTIRRRDVQRLQEREQVTASLEKFIDGVIEPLIKRPRKVIMHRAGGFILARYEGRQTFVFGVDEKEAMKRLKAWEGSAA